MALNGISALTGSVMWGCLTFLMCLGPLYAAYKFKNWYLDKENKDLRAKLPYAYLVQYCCYVLGCIFSIFGSRTGGIITDCIEIII